MRSNQLSYLAIMVNPSQIDAAKVGHIFGLRNFFGVFFRRFYEATL